MEDEVTGDWIPLMDFAARKGVSISTLRRYIKSNKMKYRVDDGRYLVWDDGKALELGVGGKPSHIKDFARKTLSTDTVVLQEQLREMEVELARAQEEIAELKTLVNLYEERINSRGQQ
jgi:hypothetical protein